MKRKEFKEKCLGLRFKALSPFLKKYAENRLKPVRMPYHGKFYCSKCGTLLLPNQKCPNCGKTGELSNKRIQYYVYNVFEKHKDIQVIRTFYIHVYHRAKMPANIYFFEVYRNFFDGYKNRLVTGLQRRPMTSDMFCFDSEWTVKRINDYYYSFKYDYAGDVEHKPNRCIIDRYRQLGFRDLEKMSSVVEMIRLPIDNLFETIVKIGYADSFIKYGTFMFPLSRAKQLFIAHKNNYKINDGQLWLDTIRMAEELGYDIKNPKYVCYQDLQKSHDKFNCKLNLIREKKELEKHRDYDQRMLKYANMVIKSDDIIIKPLITIDEVLEEGTTMHHCVYSAKYYDKKTSMLLSAKNGKGERLETIELGLRHKKVLQSRGFMNKTTPYHEKIINMVESYKF